MKKIFILLLFTFFVITTVSSQTITKNNLPKNLQGVRMNFKIDFSEAIICGLNEEDFSKLEKDWEEDKPTIVRNFKKAANLSIGKSYGIGDYSDAPYTIIVKVNTITDEGYFICNARVVDGENNTLLEIEKLTGGKEPPFMIGTKLARMKIWATLTGKTLGSILREELSNK